MRVLIVGGTGFIGRHVVKQLADLGHDVTVFHRGHTKADLPPAVSTIHGARRDLALLAVELGRLGPNVVIDMIAYTEREALDVMRAFTGRAQRIITISSGDVYRNNDCLRRVSPGPPDPVPLAEDAPLRDKLYAYRTQASGPADLAYNYEKILVERVVMGDPALPGTVLRLPMVYGPHDPNRRLFPYLRRMDDGRRAILLDEHQADWRTTRGYVENVAMAIARAAIDDRATGRVFNVGEEHALSEGEWVRTIGRAAGWDGTVVKVPRARGAETGGLAWESHLETDTSCLRRTIGFSEPVSFGEGLERTVQWIRAHPPPSIPPGEFDYPAEDRALAHLNTSRG